MKANDKRGRFAKENLRLKAAPTDVAKQHTLLAPTRMTAVIAAVLLCVLAVAAYANSINNGFVWDDHEQVVMNSSLRPGAPFLRLATTSVWGATRAEARERSNYYRPLQLVTYHLTANVFGFDARAFHSVNLTFHVIVILVAFAAFYALTSRMGLAFSAAALLAVHPIHTEAVDWIAALPDIGCTASFLLAFLFFVLACRQIPQPQPIKPWRRVHLFFLAVSCTAFVAALLWKESAVVFPLIVMAYVFCLGEDAGPASRARDALKLSFPYWCILGFYCLLRLSVLGFIAIRQRNWILSHFEFSLTELNLVSTYCWKLLVPIHFNAFYVFVPVRTLQDPRAITAILFLIISSAAIVYG